MIDCERCGEFINVLAENEVLNVNETTGGDRVSDSDTVVPSTWKQMMWIETDVLVWFRVWKKWCW